MLFALDCDRANAELVRGLEEVGADVLREAVIEVLAHSRNCRTSLLDRELLHAEERTMRLRLAEYVREHSQQFRILSG